MFIDLERCLPSKYHQNVSRFLRVTDPEKHKEVRTVAIWVGEAMLDGTRLIRFFLARGRRRTDTDSDVHKAVEAAVNGLSEEALHAFSRAVGSALLASSYQSIFLGDKYRSILLWLLKNPDREIKEPEQIVYRYRKAAKLEPKRRLARA